MKEIVNSEEYKEFVRIMNKLPFDDAVYVTDYLLSFVRKVVEK